MRSRVRWVRMRYRGRRESIWRRSHTKCLHSIVISRCQLGDLSKDIRPLLPRRKLSKWYQTQDWQFKIKSHSRITLPRIVSSTLSPIIHPIRVQDHQGRKRKRNNLVDQQAEQGWSEVQPPRAQGRSTISLTHIVLSCFNPAKTQSKSKELLLDKQYKT